ncbi:MAG TPA: ROK family protein [Methylotenera sp.]|nr:ROK family protein [Methylotenera sp.]
MLALGIDVGGTNIRFGVFDGYQLIDSVRLEANLSQLCKGNSAENAALAVVHILSGEIVNIIEKYSNIQAVGIGFPGFIQPGSKKIIQSPNLPGLSYFDLQGQLTTLLNLPVAIENDANAAAYGEYCLASKPEGGFIYLGLGTGVGGGLIVDGKLYTGQQGFAMEIGHIIIEPGGRQCGCGNKGCMEQYASASGVATSYFSATQQRLSAHEIAELANGGNKAAIDAYVLAANALAQALASIAKVLDIKNVVIGGGMTAAWPLMQQAFKARLDTDLIPVLRGNIQVKISTAEDTAGMLGAAMLALG